MVGTLIWSERPVETSIDWVGCAVLTDIVQEWVWLSSILRETWFPWSNAFFGVIISSLANLLILQLLLLLDCIYKHASPFFQSFCSSMFLVSPLWAHRVLQVVHILRCMLALRELLALRVIRWLRHLCYLSSKAAGCLGLLRRHIFIILNLWASVRQEGSDMLLNFILVVSIASIVLFLRFVLIVTQKFVNRVWGAIGLRDFWSRLLLLSGSLTVFALTKDNPLKVLESNHYNGHIVQTLSVQGVLENTFNSKTRLLMDILSDFLVFIIDAYTVPYTLGNIFVREFVEYAITC